MKRFQWLWLLLFLLTTSFFAQSDEKSLNLVGSEIVAKGSNGTYGNGVHGIGTYSSNPTYTERKGFQFDLLEIPENATITQVKVTYDMTMGGHTFKITLMESLGGGLSQIWSNIGGGTLLHAELQYGDYNFYSTPIKTAIINLLAENESALYLGALSEAEGTNPSNSELALSLKVYYTVPATTVGIVVRNDLNGADGGNIGFGVLPSNASSKDSPHSPTVNIGASLNLEAYDNQSVNSKVWFFNDTEYPSRQSEWKKKIGSNSSYLSNSQSFTTDPLTAEDDGATFTAYLKTTSYTTSGTMSEDELWWTPVTLTGDVTVGSGVTLEIASGITVNLNGHYIKCSGSGEIDKDGSVSGYQIYAKSGSDYKGFFPSSTSLQQVIDWSSSGWDIYPGANTYSEDISMKSGVDVNGAGAGSTTINGLVTFDYVSDAELKDLSVLDEIELNGSSGNTITEVNTDARIVFNYGSNNTLDEVIADHPDRYSVKATSVSPLYILDFRTTDDARYGVYANNVSYLLMEASSANYCIGFKEFGIQLSGGTNASVTNVKFEDNTYSIYAVSPASANACNCDFYYSGPNYGDVTIGCGGFQQNILADKSASLAAGDLSTVFEEGVLIFQEIQKQIKADLQSDLDFAPKKYQAEYQAALEKFLTVVTANSEAVLTSRALAYVALCYHGLQKTDELAEYLNTLATDTKYPDEIKDHARMLLVPVLVQQKEYKSALKEYDTLVKTSQTKEMQAEAQYGQGIIYGYFLKDKEQAAAAFEAVVATFPETHLAEAAQDELEHLKDRNFTAVPETPTEFTLQNYPNPFNPETEIQYALPEAGKVSIKIYDIQGREVQTLVETSQPAGVHTIRWNGQDQNGLNVASGMYFYRIHYNGKILNRKMMIIR